MLHQFKAPRFRQIILHGRSVKIGTIRVGDVVRIDERPDERRRRPVPWIVEAWLNRVHHPTGKRMSGGHLAVVRSLHDGTRATVSDALLRACVDAGLRDH